MDLLAPHPDHAGSPRSPGDGPGRRGRARAGAGRTWTAGRPPCPGRPLLAAAGPLGPRARPSPRPGRRGLPQRPWRYLPQDWRTHYRLARALQILNRARPGAAGGGGRRAGSASCSTRMTLGPKLDAAFAHLGDPAAIRTLAELCARVGLVRLAEAWRATLEESGDHLADPGRTVPGFARGLARGAWTMTPVEPCPGCLAGNNQCENETPPRGVVPRPRSPRARFPG